MDRAPKAPAPPFSALAHLECARCKTVCACEVPAQLCGCGGPLLARYDLDEAARSLTRTALADRPQALWRYHELLPVRDPAQIVSAGETITPIVPLAHSSKLPHFGELHLKDEAVLPTGSFKARGAAVAVSRARELGVTAFAMPSNGNAGAAWAVYAAEADMQAHIVMPLQAPPATFLACQRAGAHVYAVNGLINDAGRIVAKAVSRYGWYDASTLKEPYRIEGKKTLGFEIAEQFAWDLPDVIVYPTGGGVGLIGMFKAFCELQAIGLIEKRMPRFVAVQSSGCAPIVRAWRDGKSTSETWQGAHTVAFGINVPKALGDFLVLDILRKASGLAVAVDDDLIVAHQLLLAQREGLSPSAEGGATLAAAVTLRDQGVIGSDERVLLINTGSAVLGFGGIAPAIPVLEPDGEISITASA